MRTYNKDIVEHFKYHANQEVVDGVTAFFEEMNLPLPNGLEYYKTADGGTITFLNEEGLTIRITENLKRPHVEHARNLRPIFSKVCGNHRIDINPGLNAKMSWKTMSHHLPVLRSEGLSLADIHNDNFAFLTGDFSDYMVAIDPGSVTGLNHGIQSVLGQMRQMLWPERKQKDPQELLFGPLRKAFKKAFEKETPNPVLVEDAFALCREYKAKGLLLSIWEQHDYVGTTKAAQRYSLRRKCEKRRAGSMQQRVA